MRSALFRDFHKLPLLLLFAAIAHCQGPPPQQVNPHTQIRWPLGCTAQGMTYSYQTNTCLKVGPVGAGAGEVQFNMSGTWNSVPGFTFDPNSNTLSAPNLTVPGTANVHIPPSGVQWPPACTSGVYVPATNTCVPPGTAANPGGNPLDFQYNAGGTFAGYSPEQARLAMGAASLMRPVASLPNSGRTANAGNLGAQPTQVFALLGPSSVSNDSGWVFELCNSAGFSAASSPSFMAGHKCKQPTNMVVDGSGVATLTIDNTDGYFQAGGRFSAYSNVGVDGGCLVDSYILTSANPTTIVFPTAGSISPCATYSNSVAINAAFLTTSLQKFGINGASLDAWYSSPGNYGFAAYKAWIQGAITAGQMPITFMQDAGIIGNSIRLSGIDYRQWMADLIPIVTAIEAISAPDSSGKTAYVSSFPFYLASGNPEACQFTTTGTAAAPCSGGSNTGTGGVYVPPVSVAASTQLFFPYGTPGATFTSPATITTGAISAGTNTVTINPCPPDLWGGPGDALPATQDSNGLLRRHGNLIQMVLDTAASNAQELVSLSAIGATGVTGLHNFQTCTVTFTNTFAHAANAPIVSTVFTAEQQWTSWKLEVPYDIAALFPGNVQAMDVVTPFGRQTANFGFWMSNEAHPSQTGYQKIAQREIAAVASFQNAARPPLTQDPLIYQRENSSTVQRTPAIDIGFDPDAAQSARNFANGHNCGGFYTKCNIDPSMFYPTVLASSFNTTGAGFARPLMPIPVGAGNMLGDGQTGDYLYTSAGGSWQPTTLTAPNAFATNTLQYTYTGAPPMPLLGRNAIMRPYYADPAQGAKFSSHPITFPLNGTYNLKIGTSTTNNLVVSILAAQNPNVIGGQSLTCSQIEMQTGDWIVVAGNLPGASGTAGSLIQLPAGSWNPATCTWTDTSATNYSVYNNLMATLVQQFRPPDASFAWVTASKLSGVQTLTPTVGVTVQSTPIYPLGISTAFTSATTGGNCANGTSYTFGAAYMPSSWGTDYTHAGAVHLNTFTWTPSTGTTTDVIGMQTGTVPPVGYVVVFYLQISGTYYAIGSIAKTGPGVTTTCPSTGGGLIVANAVDNGSVGFSGPTLTLTSSTAATCSATIAGQFQYTQGNATTKDIVQVCAHDATNTWAWRTIY